nr:hypothetical protein [uncultured Cellulosilyticum sp.]
MACSCRKGYSEYVAQHCTCRKPSYYSPEESECTGTTPGSWSSFRRPNRQDSAIFEQAIRGLIGVLYEPLYVSTQVVAGRNYLFIAKTTVPGPTCFVDIVTVSIFVALDGTITLGEIKTVRPQ